MKPNWKNISTLVRTFSAHFGANLNNTRSSRGLRCRLDPHHPALGSGHAEGRIVRRRLHDNHEQRQDTGSGQLRVERRQCRMSNSQHDHGQRRDEDATGTGWPRNQAGETVTLKPSSLHLMLIDLKHTLEQGKTAKATLKFEHAGTIDVEFPIAAIGAAAPGAPAGRGGMKMEGHGGMMQMDKP